MENVTCDKRQKKTEHGRGGRGKNEINKDKWSAKIDVEKIKVKGMKKENFK